MKYEEKLFGYYIDFATNCDQPFEKWVKEIWSETESYILEPNAKQQLTEVMWEHHPDWLEEGEKVVILNIYKDYVGGEYELLSEEEKQRMLVEGQIHDIDYSHSYPKPYTKER